MTMDFWVFFICEWRGFFFYNLERLGLENAFFSSTFDDMPMDFWALFILDVEVAGVFSSSSMDNSSLITDKSFETASIDSESEKDSTEISLD